VDFDENQGQTLRRLQVFSIVIGEGGIGAAARKLSISQPGIAKSI